MDEEVKAAGAAGNRQTGHGLREPAMLIACLVFFVGFALIDGPFLESDSASYYTFSVFREPGYPLFLAFCRLLPGASSLLIDGYAGLYHAAFLQSLVWAFAVWRVGVCVKEVASSAAETGGGAASAANAGDNAADAPAGVRNVPTRFKPALAGWGAILIHFATCLLHRFVSQRGALYSNSILTESLAMPLFLVFIVQLFQMLNESGKACANPAGASAEAHTSAMRMAETKDTAARRAADAKATSSTHGDATRVLIVAALSLLLIILRKHMTVTLLIWGFMAFLLHLLIPKTRDVRRFLLQCALIVCVFVTAQLFTRFYNLAAFSSFSPQAGSHEGMLCMFLYVSDEEDAALFREGEEAQRQWFEEIAAGQAERGARFKDVPQGASWYERQQYFCDNYDVIGYEIVHDVLYAEAEKRIGSDAAYHEKVRLMYDLEGELVPILRRQGFADYLRVYADNLLAGLLASTTQIGRVFLPVSLMMFFVYAVLLIQTAGRIFRPGNEPSDSGTDLLKKEPSPCLLFASLVVAALLINAGVVAAVIFSQARYDSYLMGMFYSAMVLMVGNS